MFRTFLEFLRNDEGAVTVDWVVLTAGTVSMSIAVLTVVAGGINSASNSISTEIGGATSVAALISNYTTPSTLYGDASGYTAYDANAYSAYYSGAMSGDAANTYDKYQSAYAQVLDGATPENLDQLAASEQAMLDSGQDIPAGNASAASFQ